jgi:RimJ/RimL family protein N-acetyltransferase
MTDVAVVRSLLREDRPWSLYALGDLDPRRARFCDWYVRGRSVALLYREFGTPILFAAGGHDVLADLPALDACLLQVPDTFLGAVQQRLDVAWACPVLRMVIDPARFSRPEVRSPVQPLGGADAHELRELYEDGRESGEEPDFFVASQLGDGTFFGVRDNGRLVAAGGTHLYSAAESVGAIGNVYTRRAHRGRGHAAAVVTAIVERLLERGTETIGLNVRAANTGAIRLYERLGFTFHARFWEGRAVRRPGA